MSAGSGKNIKKCLQGSFKCVKLLGCLIVKKRKVAGFIDTPESVT